MEFHFKQNNEGLIIFCCYPNDITNITYKEVKRQLPLDCTDSPWGRVWQGFCN